jgi:hypothetical protein
LDFDICSSDYSWHQSQRGTAPIVIAPQIKLVSQTVVIKFLKAHRLKSPEGARAFSSQAAMPGLVVSDD